MELTTLTAISPIDGRYRKQVHHLEDYFSEYALMKYRVLVEIEYFIFLSEKKFFDLGKKQKQFLKDVAEKFSLEDAREIKELEKVTNHDVKAVEYFLKSKVSESGLEEGNEWIHFGLTSQDINNTSIPLAWKQSIENEYLPLILNLNKQLQLLAQEWKNIPMLARTHGQPASPTKLGKEMMVFVERIQNQVEQFIHVPFLAKFGGATG
ncbi:MAG: lyase family protein, partial [Chitinophagaceae bacterium]